ncbi:MAG: type IV pilus assembly protein PilM [Candidatus Omnitrophica bacterium]|nr:type IV pilus assembly protein PilM [Candidatus Omnitrophota bacterium]
MFGNLFEKKSSKPEVSVGLDIGSFSVKVAELKYEKGAFMLNSLGYNQINGDQPKEISEAIKRACDEAKISSRKVNASIFPQGTIVRYLLLPNMSLEELNKAMNFEIERYIPFGKEEVVSDYQVLKEDPAKKNMQILLVAAKKKVVDSQVKIIQDAGLDPQIITIDSLVLKNVFAVNYPEKNDVTVGLLNIGSKITNINIVRDKFSYFMRDIQLGGENFTHLIKEKLDIDIKQAEMLKQIPEDREEEIFKTIEPILGNLLNEIYLSFDYYESEFGMVVDEVYMSGGTASLKRLSHFLSDNLGRDVYPLDLTKNLSLGHNISSERLKSLASGIAVAIGLALETYN